MKATINGVIVEGTVEEIIEYQRKVNGKKFTGYPFVYHPKVNEIKLDWTYRPQIMSGGTT